MIKLFLSPLLIGLLIIIVVHIILLRKWRQLLPVDKISLITGFTVTAGVFVLSMPLAAYLLFQSLGAFQFGMETKVPDNISSVVVLSGGYTRGQTPEEDYLCGESIMRVIKGVHLFKRKNARWLVLSGWSIGGPKGRDGELMRDLSLELGVPLQKIRLETNSRNTMEHPVELLKFSDIDPKEPIAIVTSEWHIPRTMQEFRRYYQKPLPVPASSQDGFNPKGFQNYIPNIDTLSYSTTLIHEQIGIIWYKLRHIVVKTEVMNLLSISKKNKVSHV